MDITQKLLDPFCFFPCVLQIKRCRSERVYNILKSILNEKLLSMHPYITIKKDFVNKYRGLFISGCCLSTDKDCSEVFFIWHSMLKNWMEQFWERKGSHKIAIDWHSNAFFADCSRLKSRCDHFILSHIYLFVVVLVYVSRIHLFVYLRIYFCSSVLFFDTFSDF